jgi:hypothetical protein
VLTIIKKKNCSHHIQEAYTSFPFYFTLLPKMQGNIQESFFDQNNQTCMDRIKESVLVTQGEVVYLVIINCVRLNLQ